MKLEQEVSNVKVDGDISRNAVGIDTNNLGFILTIISTKLYSKPIESFIREITSNAWDSHIEAKTNDPVVISINHSVTDTSKLQVSIQDFGTGLSPERFDKVFKKAGSSTKRDTNDQIGMFGIGRFSALSVADMVHIVSNYNGKKYTYMMYKNGTEINIDLALEQDTTDPNGLIFSLDISKRDWTVLKGGIINQLRYFDNVFVKGDYSSDFNNSFNAIKIQAYNTFLISSRDPENNTSTILLGKVAYPIEINELYNYAEGPEDKKVIDSISSINKKISVKFNIGELQVTPNREQILYKEDTARTIINRFKEFFTELKEIKKNELAKEEMTFMKLYDSVDSNHYIIEFDKEKIWTSGLKYTEPVDVNKVTFPNFHEIRSLAKELMGTYFESEPYYFVNRWNEMQRYKHKITVYTLLKDATSIPDKLSLIERKYLRKHYTNFYLGQWEGMNFTKRLIKLYKKYLRKINKNTLKLFLAECIHFWNSKEHYNVNKITDEFRVNNKVQRGGSSVKYYGVQRIRFNSAGFDSKYTYTKGELSTLVGTPGADGVKQKIVVVDSVEDWNKLAVSGILQIISRNVTVITGAKTTVKLLQTIYPTLNSWLVENKALIREEINAYKRFLEYTNTQIDVDNLIDIERELKIKVGINTTEKKNLDKKFQYQHDINVTEFDKFGQTKSTFDLKKSLEHPSLLKIAEIVDSFPYRSKPEIKEIYSKSLLSYLKEVKLVDTNNKIIYS
jgi:hypothetical protein